MGVAGRDQREHGFYKGWKKKKGRWQLQLVLGDGGIGRGRTWMAWGLTKDYLEQ